MKTLLKRDTSLIVILPLPSAVSVNYYLSIVLVWKRNVFTLKCSTQTIALEQNFILVCSYCSAYTFQYILSTVGCTQYRHWHFIEKV